MKKILPFIFAFIIFIGVYSCSSDSTSPIPTLVSFVMSHYTDADSTTWFAFKPNVNVKVDSIQSKLPANNFSYTSVNQNPSYVFSKDTTYNYEGFTGVHSGQKWEFYFFGTNATNNERFSNTKATYTIP